MTLCDCSHQWQYTINSIYQGFEPIWCDDWKFWQASSPLPQSSQQRTADLVVGRTRFVASLRLKTSSDKKNPTPCLVVGDLADSWRRVFGEMLCQAMWVRRLLCPFLVQVSGFIIVNLFCVNCAYVVVMRVTIDCTVTRLLIFIRQCIMYLEMVFFSAAT